jgi:hypothetical protein
VAPRPAAATGADKGAVRGEVFGGGDEGPAPGVGAGSRVQCPIRMCLVAVYHAQKTHKFKIILYLFKFFLPKG